MVLASGCRESLWHNRFIRCEHDSKREPWQRSMNSIPQEGSVDDAGQLAWRLRWVAMGDLDGLHAIACRPAVYRYRFDGKAPAKEQFLEMIGQSMADDGRIGIGLWIVEAPMVPLGGCVQLQPDLQSRSAELSYLLDPAYWGQGLATRMAWTAIRRAFATPEIDCVFAGADCPNEASIAVTDCKHPAFGLQSSVISRPD